MGIDGVSPGRPAIFLDRDGTLNRAFVVDDVSHPPATEAQLELLPGVSDALGEAKRAGFVLVVVTNQPDVARGLLLREIAERINAALRERLPPIDELMCCYHDDADRCECRKPAPGMLLAAAHRLGIDLAQSFMIGDSWRDWEAGRRAGCTTVRVGTAAGTEGHAADYIATDVPDAVLTILRLLRARRGETVVENLRR